MGVTRRVSHFEDPSLQIWFVIAGAGAVLIAAGIACFLIQLVVSYQKREQLCDWTGDPWDARTLEWATSSPPPDYNFAFTPVVHEIDAWWDMKKHGYQRPLQGFKPIHMPANTAAGVVVAGFSLVFGFALIWHMWLLVGVSFVALLLCAIVHTFNYQRDFYIPAAQVTATEENHTLQLARHV
jgi:cytochrome o ubiquinol oxidase subunit I